MSFVRLAAASVALLAAFAGPAAAQDAGAAPAYGNVRLQTGFTPDPYTVNIQAGGTINAASSLGGSCTGFVANAPDFDLYYTAGSSLPLIISAVSNSDTTLIVNAPDGSWYCDDDSGGNLDPKVVFAHPQTGLYDIWIGTFSSGSLAPSTLSISEVR